MLIATTTDPEIIVKSAVIDSTQVVRFTDWNRADRTKRQIIDNITSMESAGGVQMYMADETMMLDALFLFDPDMSAEITEAASDHIANLQHGAASAGAPAPIPAIAQSQEPLGKEKKMSFDIDTGNDGGSLGPWMSWTSNGSAMKGFPPKSWVLRGKDQNGEKFESVIPAFANGCVLDLDTLQLGWMKDGATGQAPEKRWNPTISQATQRPDESKKPSGAYAWSSALSVRCAIGGGDAATWEQASFGAYDAFSKLTKQISAEWGEKSQNGKLLPLVKQTGVETQQLKSGSSNKPVLQVIDWVERPDCLKADAPEIATAPTEAPKAATPAPAPAPAPAQTAATAGGF